MSCASLTTCFRFEPGEAFTRASEPAATSADGSQQQQAARPLFDAKGRIRVWDIASGKCLAELAPPPAVRAQPAAAARGAGESKGDSKRPAAAGSQQQQAQADHTSIQALEFDTGNPLLVSLRFVWLQHCSWAAHLYAGLCSQVSVSTYTSEKSKTGGTCDVIVWDWQTGKIVARTRLDWPVHEGDWIILLLLGVASAGLTVVLAVRVQSQMGSWPLC